MENLNVVNDTQQAVVEPAQVSSDTGAVDSGTPEPDVNAESAVRTQNKVLRRNSGNSGNFRIGGRSNYDTAFHSHSQSLISFASL